SSGSAEAGDKTSFDWVGSEVEHDWNRGGRLPRRQRRRSATSRDNHARLTTDQFGRQRRQSIVLALRPAIFDGQVSALDIAGFTQPIAEHAQTVAKRIRPFRTEHTNHRHGRLLRACRERPKTRRHGRRAAEQRYELAALHSITSSARASSIGGASR